MKFLVDMNLSPLWAPFLASHGFGAVHWSTVGQPSAPDREILAAKFFPLDSLPEDATRATRARLAEILDGRPLSPTW